MAFTEHFDSNMTTVTLVKNTWRIRSSNVATCKPVASLPNESLNILQEYWRNNHLEKRGGWDWER